MKRLGYIAVGLLAGILASLTVPSFAAWLVQSNGEASVQLASLEALKVGKATVDGEALPGKQVALVADVENGNPITLTIISSSLVGLRSEDAACDVGAIDYLDSKADVEPGENEDVVLGRLVLPKALANACQGDTLSATVSVKAAYGEQS